MSASDVISVILLAAMSLFSFRSVRYALRLLQGENRRRMFAPLLGTLCDGVGNVGLSVICTEAGSVATVADLLAVEYERYEVIVVLDSAREPELLERLSEIYALVSVDYRRSDDFAPSVCVRRLYRSRRRRFGRLTVLDTVSLSPEIDADAAVDIAVHNYITVVRGDVVLLPCAVERIIAEICSSNEPPREVTSEAGMPLTVFMRDDVAAAGGFVSGRDSFCSRRQRRRIYETLAVSCGERADTVIVAVLAALFCAVVVLFALLTDNRLPVAALIATLAVAAASVFLSVPFVMPHLKGRPAFAGTVRNFCEKLLLKISQ